MSPSDERRSPRRHEGPGALLCSSGSSRREPELLHQRIVLGEAGNRVRSISTLSSAHRWTRPLQRLGDLVEQHLVRLLHQHSGGFVSGGFLHQRIERVADIAEVVHPHPPEQRIDQTLDAGSLPDSLRDRRSIATRQFLDSSSDQFGSVTDEVTGGSALHAGLRRHIIERHTLQTMHGHQTDEGIDDLRPPLCRLARTTDPDGTSSTRRFALRIRTGHTVIEARGRRGLRTSACTKLSIGGAFIGRSLATLATEADDDDQLW
jgi:hypothetical protein